MLLPTIVESSIAVRTLGTARLGGTGLYACHDKTLLLGVGSAATDLLKNGDRDNRIEEAETPSGVLRLPPRLKTAIFNLGFLLGLYGERREAVKK
jgi:hypothetical protein